MVNGEDLIGTTEYLILEMRQRINQCNCNWVRLYFLPKYWGMGQYCVGRHCLTEYVNVEMIVYFI